MPALTFTPAEFQAFQACWDMGHEGLPDRRWIAVEIALSDALADLEGVDLELDDDAFADARSAFAVGWEGFIPKDPEEEAMAAYMDAAAIVLELVPAPSMRH